MSENTAGLPENDRSALNRALTEVATRQAGEDAGQDDRLDRLEAKVKRIEHAASELLRTADDLDVTLTHKLQSFSRTILTGEVRD